MEVRGCDAESPHGKLNRRTETSPINQLSWSAPSSPSPLFYLGLLFVFDLTTVLCRNDLLNTDNSKLSSSSFLVFSSVMTSSLIFWSFVCFLPFSVRSHTSFLYTHVPSASQTPLYFLPPKILKLIIFPLQQNTRTLRMV